MKTKHVLKSHEAQDPQRLEPSPAASAPQSGEGPWSQSLLSHKPGPVTSQRTGLPHLQGEHPDPRVSAAFIGRLLGALPGGDMK